MAAALTAIGTSLHIGTNPVEASSYRPVESSRKNFSNGRATTIVAARGSTPLKPTMADSLRHRTSSSPSTQNGSSRQMTKIQSVSVSDKPATATTSDLPLKEIPGTYGLPFFGAIKDRLDFFWFQPVPKFYEARRDKYNSTVYRTNVPPGPPFYPDPRVVVLLDEKSFPILFDNSKVWKKDVFTGTYHPSWSKNDGYRVLAYLDPTEKKHEQLKAFAFEILKAAGPRSFPALAESMGEVFTQWETGLKSDGKVDYEKYLRPGTFKFMMKSFTTRDPFLAGEASLGDNGPSNARLWLLSQIGPVSVVPVPWFIAPLIELFLHTLPIPTFLVKGQHDKLLKFFGTYGTELLDIAEKELGLSRQEALENYTMMGVFNAWGGVDIFFPSLIKRLGSTSAEFQKELAAEVRKVVKENGGRITPQALAAMPIVESTVYEALRIDPPVPFQYAIAKEDLVIESHDAAFQIKKGETLAGYMPTTTHDPKIFDDADSFLPKRFLGDKGKALLKYVLWSNGPQTEEPTVNNKHCPGKNFVLTLSQLFVATIYSKYDALTVDSTSGASLTSLKSATS